MEKETTRESEAWNIAKGYASYKILKILVEMDKHETMSIYGTWEIEDSFSINPETRIVYRVEAMYRFIDNFHTIFDNCWFVILKNSNDVKSLETLEKELEEVEKYSSAIKTESKDEMRGQTKEKINELHFREMLKALRNIKRKLHSILDKHDLIFRSVEDMSLDEIKKKFIEEG